MDTSINPTQIVNTESSLFSIKDIFIVLLVALLIFSFLGVNLLSVSGEAFEYIKDTFFPMVEKLAAMFGYSTGIMIDKGAETSTDAIKYSADIANGALGSLSDLLIAASKPKLESDEQTALDTTLTLNKPLCSGTSATEPKPDSSVSSTQASISSGKQKWCLVEESGAKRGCVRIEDADKCMSGQVFPHQEMCLNPNISP
jgi:hypothetical protein